MITGGFRSAPPSALTDYWWPIRPAAHWFPLPALPTSTSPLKPWGAIEGTLLVGSEPAANLSLNVGFNEEFSGNGAWSFDYNTKTDAKGKFKFTQVPPGVHQVQRLIKFSKGKTGVIGFSHGETVTVRAGETTQVVLGGKGIAVVGRLRLSPPVANFDWSLDLQALVQQRPDLPEVRWQDFPDGDQPYSRAFSARDSQIAKYYLVIAPGGSFRTDDVLPGDYCLEVKISAPLAEPLAKDPWMQPRPELGKLNMPMVVPAAAPSEPMNLGTITISISNSVPATAASN